MRAYLLFVIIFVVGSDVFFDAGASFDQKAYRNARINQAFEHRSSADVPDQVEWNHSTVRFDAGPLMERLNRTPGFGFGFYLLVIESLLFGLIAAGTACAVRPGLFRFDGSPDSHRRGAFLLNSRLPAIFCGRCRIGWVCGAGAALALYLLTSRFAEVIGFQRRALVSLGVGYGIGFFGVFAWSRARRIGPAALRLGHVSIPSAIELYHFLIAGRTGAGKTQAIQQLLRPARARTDRGLIADPDGGYLARFGTSSDLILNPFDQRGLRWSPFAEIRAPFDYDVLANAVIPSGNSANEEEWRRFGRVLLSTTLRRLHQEGRTSAREVLHVINAAGDDQLQTLLAGTNAAGLRRHDALFHSILGVVTPHIQSWEYLIEPDAQHPAFSIRDWVRSNRSEWLFLPYRDDQLDALKHLLATWIALAVTEALSLPENLDRRFWFVIDELDSLGKVASLRLAATKLRKHGGVMVAGLQTVAQLRATYGYDEAQIILSSLANKLVLAVGDHETARYFQDELGQREIVRRRVTRQHGRSGSHSTGSTSESNDVSLEHLVLASELQGLSERSGYLRRAGDALIHPVRVPLVPMPMRLTPFVPVG